VIVDAAASREDAIAGLPGRLELAASGMVQPDLVIVLVPGHA
jgi:hypothetical protein